MPAPRDELATVRQRPGMFIGDHDAAPLHMVLDLVANAVDLYLAGRSSRIAVRLHADGFVEVEDDGPGFARDGSGAVPPLHELLTTHSRKPTVDGHRPHVHLGFGGVSLFVVAALSERFEITTTRDGVQTRGVYVRGCAVEPLASAPSTAASGTCIRFRPDPEIYEHARVACVDLVQRLDDLRFLLPGLRIDVQLIDLVSGGLAARVAHRLGIAVDRVASHRGTYDTPTGPIDVDVALAWNRHIFVDSPPEITSFANYQRTRDGGTHVDGLLAGVSQFLGAPHELDRRGVVAAINVVLPDVKYGTPSKDLLATVEASEPCRLATAAALAAWRERHPARRREILDRLAELDSFGPP